MRSEKTLKGNISGEKTFYLEESESSCFKAYYEEDNKKIYGLLRKLKDKAPYELILEKQRGKYSKNLSFVVPFEIYNDEGDMYAWAEGEFKSLKDICDEKISNESRKLLKILEAIKKITECVSELHTAGVIYNNSQTSGLWFREDMSVAMFDIDTVRRADNEGVESDIRVIGDMLFKSVISDSEYKENYYANISDLVHSASLIEKTVSEKTQDLLVCIFRGCLSEDKDKKYKNCKALSRDIAKACELIRNQKKEVLPEQNPLLAIQYHLYEYPFYEFESGEQGDRINVLIVGFGEYSQLFLDTCLQVGQIPDKSLNICVFSNDATAIMEYLNARPGLKDFFELNMNINKLQDVANYGTVTFCDMNTEESTAVEQSQFIVDQIKENMQDGGYVFVDLEDDQKSRSYAEFMLILLLDVNENWIVNFACKNVTTKSLDNMKDKIYPVYVNADVHKSKFYHEIEEMAFNIHLLWKKSLVVDYKKVWKEFKKKYNYDSCISCALSVKYKLNGIGISLRTLGFEAAAKEFNVAIEKKPSVREKLGYMEHRRWVAEKLCAGWTTLKLSDIKDSIITRDEKNKKHICIVYSTEKQSLKDASQSVWDKEGDITGFDELDQVSVKLHRKYVDKAKEVKRENLIWGDWITDIKKKIEDDGKALAAFQEWYTCLKDLWDDKHDCCDSVNRYEELKTVFLNSVNNENKKSVRALTEKFSESFYPVLESRRYKDYKQNDITIIDNIPFILTYSRNAYMVVPYEAADTGTGIFRNVYAASIVNPKKLVYLYMIERESDKTALYKTLKYVMNYMDKKQMRSEVEFIIAIPKELKENKVEKKIKDIDHRVKSVEFIRPDTIQGMSEEIIKYINKRWKRQQNGFFTAERNETKMSTILWMEGFYEKLQGYQFDSYDMKFSEVSGCELCNKMQFMPRQSGISAAEMFALGLADSKSSNRPGFSEDYSRLWRKYKGDYRVGDIRKYISNDWKSLCKILSENAKKNDVRAKLEPKKQEQTKQTYKYIMPVACFQSAKKIIDELIKREIVEEESEVRKYKDAWCEVIICDKVTKKQKNKETGREEEIYCNKEKYDKLFAEIYELMDPDAIEVYVDAKNQVIVKIDSLIASDVEFKSDEGRAKDLLKDYFCNTLHYIRNYAEVSQKISFIYGTRQIKELLTKEGKILEIYTYYKAKQCGKFDEVLSSYEIDYGGTGLKNEFDLILTKGFQTLFVECKATKEIKQDYYYKLKCLTDQFGINATAVLVADTEEIKGYKEDNDVQIRRGEKLNIETIYTKDDIRDIGNKLSEKLIKE